MFCARVPMHWQGGSIWFSEPSFTVIFTKFDHEAGYEKSDGLKGLESPI